MLLGVVTLIGGAAAAATGEQSDFGACIPGKKGEIIGSNEWKTAQHPSPHAASAGACCDWCTANSKVGVAGQKTCKAFTFEPQQKGGAQCILKDNVETSHGGLPGMVSGSIHQLPPPAPPWVPPGPVVPIPRACEPPHDTYPFCNTTLGLDERVDDLIKRLTLDEKPYAARHSFSRRFTPIQT